MSGGQSKRAVSCPQDYRIGFVIFLYRRGTRARKWSMFNAAERQLAAVEDALRHLGVDANADECKKAVPACAGMTRDEIEFARERVLNILKAQSKPPLLTKAEKLACDARRLVSTREGGNAIRTALSECQKEELLDLLGIG
jgi:hypothetical protein